MSIPHYVSDKVDCKEWGSALLKASRLGNSNQLREVLHCREADVNYADRDGQTSLLLATLHGHLDVVKIILSKKGIDVNKAKFQVAHCYRNSHYLNINFCLSIVRFPAIL